MKTRESGMPDEAIWEGFFEPEQVLQHLGLTEACGDVVEFGCGYGTFTIPAARISRGTVHAFDIEPEMVAATIAKARAAGLTNLDVRRRDFLTEGTGLADRLADHVMLFNILHAEQPQVLLREAQRVLRPGGILAIMHWRHDPATPRGPSMAIRPRPEQCRQWAQRVGFELRLPGPIDLPPYHYGWVMHRPGEDKRSRP